MASAILESEKTLPRPSVASIMPKDNEKQVPTKAASKDKQPPSAVVQNSSVRVAMQNPKPKSTISAPRVSAKEKATAIKSYNSEVLGILKELSSNHTIFSDKLEKLSSRVDSIYNGSNECDYGDNQSENSYMSNEHYDQDYENYAYGGDIIKEDTADPQFLEEDSEESPPKKQKTDSSIFKNISEKFNPKEVTDHDIDSARAGQLGPKPTRPMPTRPT